MKELYLLSIAASYCWDVDLKDPKRTPDLFYARSSFFKAARDLIEPKISLQSLGNFCGKDHATVIHSCKMYKNYRLIKRFCLIDDEVRVKFEQYKEKYKNVSLMALKGNIPAEKENIIARAVQTEIELQKKIVENEILFDENLKLNSLISSLQENLDPFIVEIMNEPKYIRDEFNVTRWKTFKHMLSTRKTYPIFERKQAEV